MKIKILPVNSANEVHTQLAAEYDLRTNAIEDGKQNLPAWNSTDYSVTENRIITDIKEAMEEVNTTVLSGIRRTQEKLNQLGRELESLFIPTDMSRLKIDLADLYSEKTAQKHYSEYYRDFKAFEPHWNGFREENSITQPAKYPDSLFASITWVAFIIFIEAIANSYLFAKGSDFGLIGGIFQALIVSLLNAGVLGFMMGFVSVRQLNHIHPWRKVMGGAAAVAIFLAVVVFNLAVGHYRQQLVIGSLEPARDALVSFSAHPGALADFEAWLLFFLGITAFIISSYKCYHLDDPYPGYGDVDRRYRSLRLRVKDEFERLHQGAERMLDLEIAKLDGIFDQYHRNLTEYARLAPTLTAQAAAAVTDVKLLDAALKTLLQEYQETNARVRAARPCEYWEKKYIEGDRFIKEAELMSDEAGQQWKQQSSRLDQFKRQVDAEQRSVSDLRRGLHEAGSEIIKEGSSGFKAKLEKIFNGDGAIKRIGDHLNAQP